MTGHDFDEFDAEMLELERHLRQELEDRPGSDREDLQRRPHVGYLVLYTADVEDLAQFYEGVFGFQRAYESGSAIELHAGSLILTIADEGNLVDTAGLDHVPASAATRSSHSILVEDVEGCAEAAIALGAQMIREPYDTEWGMRSCWVRDPAGHLLEIGRFVRRP